MDDIETVLELTAKRTRKAVVGAIVQARMTSERFPGKSMAILKGKPVLEHVLMNVKAIRGLDRVILAVPDTPESEPMLQLASKLEVDNFCGDELNVLKRYHDAAKFFDLDVIMRITENCPFINPDVCAEVLNLLQFRKLDYSCNCYPDRTYPKGLDCECFTRDCLDTAYALADPMQPGDWEHVTPWMRRTTGVRRGNVQQHQDASDINLCVDYPEDLARLETIIFHVGKI